MARRKPADWQRGLKSLAAVIIKSCNQSSLNDRGVASQFTGTTATRFGFNQASLVLIYRRRARLKAFGPGLDPLGH